MAKRSRTADKTKEADPAPPTQRGEIRIPAPATSRGEIVLPPSDEGDLDSHPLLASISRTEDVLDEVLAEQNAPIPYWASALVDLAQRQYISFTSPFDDADRIFEPALKSHAEWLSNDVGLQERSDDRLCLIQLGLEIPSSLASEYRDKASSLGEAYAHHKSELQSLNLSFLSHFESHWNSSYSSFYAQFRTAFLGEQTNVRIVVRVIANPTTSWGDILGIAPLLLRGGEECYDDILTDLRRHYYIAPGRNEPTAKEIAEHIGNLGEADLSVAVDALFKRLSASPELREKYVKRLAAPTKTVEQIEASSRDSLAQLSSELVYLGQKPTVRRLNRYLKSIEGSTEYTFEQRRQISSLVNFCKDSLGCTLFYLEEPVTLRARKTRETSSDFQLRIAGTSKHRLGSTAFPLLTAKKE